MSHHEKPLEIVNQCSKEDMSVTFELRHLNQQSQSHSSSNLSMTSCNVSSVYSMSLQSYSHGRLPEPLSLNSELNIDNAITK